MNNYFTNSEIRSAIKIISPNKEIERILILRMINQSTWEDLGIGRIEKMSIESYANEVVKYLVEREEKECKGDFHDGNNKN